MDNFAITQEIKIDLKIKSVILDGNWFCLNLEHMMCMRASENAGSIGPHDKFYPGPIYPMKLTNKGLHYYDQNMVSWRLMEENVQRVYSDYIADKELLGE